MNAGPGNLVFFFLEYSTSKVESYSSYKMALNCNTWIFEIMLCNFIFIIIVILIISSKGGRIKIYNSHIFILYLFGKYWVALKKADGAIQSRQFTQAGLLVHGVQDYKPGDSRASADTGRAHASLEGVDGYPIQSQTPLDAWPPRRGHTLQGRCQDQGTPCQF